MKKNIKAVLACTAALVIAGGGYAVLMLTGANEDSGNSSTSSIAENSISVPTELFSFEKADIISVSAENAGGGFEALPVGKPAEDDLPRHAPHRPGRARGRRSSGHRRLPAGLRPDGR